MVVDYSWLSLAHANLTKWIAWIHMKNDKNVKFKRLFHGPKWLSKNFHSMVFFVWLAGCFINGFGTRVELESPKWLDTIGDVKAVCIQGGHLPVINWAINPVNGLIDG